MKAKKISVGFMEFYRGNQEERIIGQLRLMICQ